MPNKFEYNLNPFLHEPDDGGHLFGVTEDEDGDSDGYCAYTSHGEFACKFPDYGGMLAIFPERGLLFHYNDEGDLDVARLDLTVYLYEMVYGKNKDILAKLPNKGKNIATLVNYLVKNDVLISATLDMEEKTFVTMQTENGKEPITLAEVNGVDYRRGIVGKLDFGDEFSLAIEFIDYGDDIFMGVGEYVGKKKNTLIGVEFSHHVEFEDEIFGKIESEDLDVERWLNDDEEDSPEWHDVLLDPKRFDILARKVLLAKDIVVKDYLH